MNFIKISNAIIKNRIIKNRTKIKEHRICLILGTKFDES